MDPRAGPTEETNDRDGHRRGPEWRGLIAQTTDEDALRKAFADGPVTAYCGFDPPPPASTSATSPRSSPLRRLQLAGHRPIALVGGATGLIGDPKPSAERQLNEASTVREWVEPHPRAALRVPRLRSPATTPTRPTPR
ncbi:hypothetical protein ACU686_01695 [Yinghuangia aomiensis]